MIQAITFDFWDTLVIDDSDEPKRAVAGLPPKPQARLNLLVEEITQHYPHVGQARIEGAFQHANQRFRRAWEVEHYTPTVAARVMEVYDYLGLAPTSGFDAVVRGIEQMEIDISPDFVAGVDEVIPTLAARYKLGIISDAIHTTGLGIRLLLERQGLLEHFSAFVFSDEAGASKPIPVVFENASAALGVPLEHIVHVGDRESNDVEGPLAVGMKALLFTGVVDRGSDHTSANSVCRDLRELPGIIEKLDRLGG